MSNVDKHTIADDFPLPECAHVPGMNERPGPLFLEGICNRAAATTTSETASDNLAWNYGLRLFNNGYYWECHEVLEAVWMNAAPNSREKHLVQAVIHLANAMLKMKMNRKNAALRLFEMAEASLGRAGLGSDAPFMGLQLIDIREITVMSSDNKDVPQLITNFAL